MKKRDLKWSETACKLMEVKLQAKALALIESELSEELKELSEGFASYDDNGYVFKPFIRKGIVDYKKVPELHNVNLEPYRGEPSIYWKLDIIK